QRTRFGTLSSEADTRVEREVGALEIEAKQVETAAKRAVHELVSGWVNEQVKSTRDPLARGTKLGSEALESAKSASQAIGDAKVALAREAFVEKAKVGIDLVGAFLGDGEVVEIGRDIA